MKKKTITIVLSLLMVLSALVLPCSASAAEAEITGVQLALGQDISVTYFTTFEFASNLAAKVSINGRESVVKVFNQDGKAVFRFDSIAPHELGADITAEIYRDGSSTGVVKETTIKDICALYLDNSFDGYSDEAKAAVYRLVSNLLQYGECARIYKGVPGSVTDDVTSANYDPDPLPSPVGEKTVVTSDENLALKGISVFFDTTNRLYVRFTTTDITKARFTVNGVNYTNFRDEGGRYSFFTTAIYARDICQPIAVAGYFDGAKKFSLTYSVEQYTVDLENASVGDDMVDLSKSLYSYGAAAEDYAAQQNSGAGSQGASTEPTAPTYEYSLTASADGYLKNAPEGINPGEEITFFVGYGPDENVAPDIKVVNADVVAYNKAEQLLTINNAVGDVEVVVGLYNYDAPVVVALNPRDPMPDPSDENAPDVLIIDEEIEWSGWYCGDEECRAGTYVRYNDPDEGWTYIPEDEVPL